MSLLATVDALQMFLFDQRFQSIGKPKDHTWAPVM